MSKDDGGLALAGPQPETECVEARRMRLTAAQSAIWAAHSLQPDVAAWSVPVAVRIHGPLDRPAFSRAFSALVRSADSLRMIAFEADGAPWQELRSDVDATVETVDFRGAGDEACEAWLAARAARVPDLSQRHFDTALIALSDDDHVWFFNQHHLFTDGWTNGLLLHRMSRLYLQEIGADRRVPPAFPPLLDRLREVRRYEESPAAGADREYLTALLDDDVEPYKFFGVTPTRAGNVVAPVAYALDADRTAKMRAIAAAVGNAHDRGLGTRFHLTAAIVVALLYRLTGRRSIAIGSPYHNRHAGDDKQTSALLRQTPGLFADVLPLVVNIQPADSFARLVGRVRDAWVGATEHARGGIGADVRRRACDVVLNYAYVPVPQLFGARTAFRWLPTGHGRESLAIRVDDFDSDDQLQMRFDFEAGVFPEHMRPRVVDRFLRLVDACLDNPSAAIDSVSLLPVAERARLEAWNGPRIPGTTDVPAPDLIEAQAARTPDAIAVESGGEQLTYAMLDAQAATVAAALRARGVGRETLVGLCIERSIPQIVGLLGIHRAGGAYLPLDPKLPADRLRYLLRNAGTAHLVTTRAHRHTPSFATQDVLVIEEVLERAASGSRTDAAVPREAKAGPGNLAYVIYTSGSTGAPKGVEIEHRSVANLITFSIAFFQLAPGDRWLQFNSLNFDFSVEEILPTLASGATLVLRSDAMIDSAEGFLDAVDRLEISVLALPTAYWHTIVDVAAGRRAFPRRVRLVAIGGEAARPDLLARWHEWVGPGVRLLNGYGPTEATVAITFAELTGRGREESGRPMVSIGTPLWNGETHVLDAAGHPTGPGFAGELFIGGVPVGRGYRGDPALTATRFVPHPTRPGARVYRTGDAVRWRETGELEYIGRLDQQVKVRGYRVEPGEIETHLHACPWVREAVVVPHVIGAETRLAAYVGTGDQKPTTAELRDFLEGRLPSYMVPSVFVVMARLPRSTSGKVDRRALPPPTAPAIPAEQEPMSDTEAAIAAIWREELRVDRVGRSDSFFDLGGESLLGIRVVGRMTQVLGRSVALSLLFDHPTVAGLAAAVGSLPSVPAPRVVARGRRPNADGHVAQERQPAGADLKQ